MTLALAGPVQPNALPPPAPLFRQFAGLALNRSDLGNGFVMHCDYKGLALLGLLNQIAEPRFGLSNGHGRAHWLDGRTL